MEKRAHILCTAILIGFALVLIQLAHLMLFNHKRYTKTAEGQYEAEVSMPVYRGDIFDRGGRDIALSVDVLSAFANPREMKSREAAARALGSAGVEGVEYGSILKRLAPDRRFVWVKRKLTEDAALKLRERDIEGVGFLTEVKRYYPKGLLASHVVGFVGVDNQALGGVELKYNEMLEVQAKKVSFARDAAGRALSSGIELERRGNALVLTLDEGLQYVVETELERAMLDWDAASISAIMMDPHTGEILAMANRPTFDPNAAGKFVEADKRNRAITDTLEPGSTMKLVTAAAAIETGAVTSSDLFDCSAGFIKVGNRTVHDAHKLGVLTFREVIQKSSNVGTIMAAERLGADTLNSYVGRFGFGEKTGIDLPGESRGLLDPIGAWRGERYLSVSIGYGVGATPLQILRAYAAIANGGLLVKPHVVREVVAPDGGVLYRAAPEGLTRAVSEETAALMRDMLVSVTIEGGTATEASVDGNLVAGKTGTARLIDAATGLYSSHKYASSFVGFVPADAPRFALIVVVYEPQKEYYGGVVAAPIFKRIAEKSLAYMSVPRDDAFRENVLYVRRARETG